MPKLIAFESSFGESITKGNKSPLPNCCVAGAL
jgi:hypothetical protein